MIRRSLVLPLALILILLTVGVCIFVPMTLIPQPKIFTVGISQWNSDPDYETNIQGFKAGLAQKGFYAGKNIRYIQKNPYGKIENQIDILQAFVDEKVDLIYSLTTPGTLIAKGVTSKIPIVFSIVTYPVETGVIQSLVSSENNLVGIRNYVPAVRQYYYFEKLFPDTKTLAFVHHRGEPNAEIQLREFKDTLKTRHISVIDIAAVDLDDLQEQLQSQRNKVDALYMACDTLIQNGGDGLVIAWGQTNKKPTFSCLGGGVVNGALYGDVVDVFKIGRIAGDKAALILSGASPTNINTESFYEDHILINKKTADEFNIIIPKVLLEKAARIYNSSENNPEQPHPQ